MIVRALTNPPFEEMVSLLHESFRERQLQGLNFSCASFTTEELKSHLSSDAIVFGAIDDEKLIGMLILNRQSVRKGIKFAYHEYLAVSSCVKRQGIGTALFVEMKRKAVSLGLDFVLSDTADKADSSVRYHLKNGFKIFGKSHYSNRTYDSYNFILPLSLRGKILSAFPFKYKLRQMFTVNN